MSTTPPAAAKFTVESFKNGASAVLAKTGRLLASEYLPAGSATDWAVFDFHSRLTHHATAEAARAALVAAAEAAVAELPPCGMTHGEHWASWRSWRDDCVDETYGCGFCVQDVDQCRRGHPDDGLTVPCGAPDCGPDAGRATT